MTDSDVLAMPPIPYSREGANALKELQTRPPVFDLQDIQTSHGFGTLASKLREGLEGGDTLIVYLTCNCLSDVAKDGPAAWLLCSDFAVRPDIGGAESKRVGRYRLRDVLLQMKECKAKTKLLILDSGYLNYDPRLAVFVNEFPRLLEEEVRAVDDPDLWVLCSCQAMETSHVCGAEKRSVFNYFVTEPSPAPRTRRTVGSSWKTFSPMFGRAWPTGLISRAEAPKRKHPGSCIAAAWTIRRKACG